MDQSVIDQLVNDVLGHLAQEKAASSRAGVPAVNSAAAPSVSSTSSVAPPLNTQITQVTLHPQIPLVVSESLPDLGGEEIRTLIGIRSANKPEVVQALRGATRARICVGRSGPRPRTLSMLRFLADHSRSKETVLSEIPSGWVTAAGLLELHTEATEINQYLTRPDLGRILCEEGKATLREKCVQQPDVQIVVSNGLSTEAVTANFEEIFPPLTRYLAGAGLTLGTPMFVRFGRVKVEDQIGHLLGAKVVILLIGERPGLGQSESLSCYMVYKPTATTVEAERTCISNIHRSGTPPVEAAAVIAELAGDMIRHQASGIALTRSLQGKS